MKSASVKFSELMKGNKRSCLSARRVLGRCYECCYYGDKQRYTPCESRIINPVYDELMRRKWFINAEAQAKIDEINKQIGQL